MAEAVPAPLTLLIMPWGRVGSNMVNAALTELHVKVFNEPLTGIRSRNADCSEVAIADAQMAWLRDNLDAGVLAWPAILNHAAISTADPGRMRDWIRMRHPRLILLDRGDDAAVALSSARAEAWIAEGREKGEKRSWSISRSVAFRPHIDPAILRRNLDILRKGRAIMLELAGDSPALRLGYEDLVADMEGSMTAILRHAGIPWGRFSIHTGRFGSDSLTRMVANPEELAAVIREDGGPTRLDV